MSCCYIQADKSLACAWDAGDESDGLNVSWWKLATIRSIALDVLARFIAPLSLRDVRHVMTRIERACSFDDCWRWAVPPASNSLTPTLAIALNLNAAA
jgi:hypothetical protein